MSIPVPHHGTYVLMAKVVGGQPGRGFSHVTSAYLRVSERGPELVPPERFKHEENLAAPLPARKEKEGAAESGWQLHLNITVTYVGPDGVTHPLPHARVDIYEDDLSFDDFLGNAILHDDGKVSGTVTVPTDPLGVDEIYLVVFTDNGKRFYLGTGTSDSKPLTSYHFTSSSHRVTEGSTANISYKITSHPEALTVWSFLNTVWTYGQTDVGFPTSEIDVWYPGSGAPDGAYFSEQYNLIAVGEEYTRDRW